MNKLVNSVRFWCGKLAKAQKDNNVIIGLYNNSRNVSISFQVVLDALDTLGISMKLRGFNSFRNPRFMNFVFDSKETREYVQKHLKKIGDSDIVYLDWGSTNDSVAVKAHWVPLDLPVEKVIHVLSKFVKVSMYNRESQNTMDGRSFPNGTIAFKAQLKPNVDIRNIPHLCEVDGLEILINVTGRKILCLNCGLLGHKSSECPTPFCSICKRRMAKLHECIANVGGSQTYAQVLSASGLSTDDENDIAITRMNTDKLSTNLTEETTLRAKEGRAFWTMEKPNNANKSVFTDKGGLADGDTGSFEGERKTRWADENGVDQMQTEADKDNSDQELSEAEQTLRYVKELEELRRESAQYQNQIKSLVDPVDKNISDLSVMKPMEIDVVSSQQKRKMEEEKLVDISQKLRQTSDNLSLSVSGPMKNYSRRGGGGNNKK